MKKIITRRATEKRILNIFEKGAQSNQSVKKAPKEKPSEQRVIKSTVGKKRSRVGK